MKYNDLKVGDVVWSVVGLKEVDRSRLKQPEPFVVVELDKEPDEDGCPPRGQLYVLPGTRVIQGVQIGAFPWNDDRLFKTRSLAWGAFFQKRQELFDQETECLQRKSRDQSYRRET